MQGWEVSPEALVEEIRTNPDLLIVDVREPHEWQLCRIEGALHLPLATVADRLDQLESHRDIVTYCHHGARSTFALQLLRDAGYPRVRSLRGGIDAWAETIDPAMERY